ISLRRVVNDSINATKSGRLLELVTDDVIAHIFRDVGPLLDDAAIHVDDVERAIRSVRQPYRTEPLIRRRQKLSSVVGLAHAEARAGVVDDNAAHVIGGGLGGKRVAIDI